MNGSQAEVAQLLADIGAVRFGSFRLKDGRTSPFYIDLRSIVSYPRALRRLAVALAEKANTIPFDVLAGIPYAGLPLALATALEMDRPMIYPRKEAKGYGTARTIEGRFEPGNRALVIDDVITSGGAKEEAVALLREHHVVVEDILVVVDRSRNAAAALAERGLRLHSVLKVDELLAALLASGHIDQRQWNAARSYLQESEV